MVPAQAVKFGTLLSPTTSAVTTARTANIDCVGADYCTIIVNMSAEKNTSATGVVLSVLSADDTNSTSFATVVANRTEDLTTAHSVMYCVPVQKRYVRLSATPDTTTNGDVIISAVYQLSRLEDNPASTSNMVVSTHDVAVVVSPG